MVLHLIMPVELAGVLGCAGIYPQVVPQQLEGQGRGLVARQPIRAGEQILAVPEGLVLLPPTAAAGMVTPACTRHVCPSIAVPTAPPESIEAHAYKSCSCGMLAKQWLQGYEFAWTLTYPAAMFHPRLRAYSTVIPMPELCFACG